MSDLLPVLSSTEVSPQHKSVVLYFEGIYGVKIIFLHILAGEYKESAVWLTSQDVQWHQQRRMQWQQLLGHQKCLHQKQQHQHEQTVLMVLLSFSAMEKKNVIFLAA